MHSQLPVWQFLKTHLEQGENVTLLYVIESLGSSPGRQGFCMAVAKNGDQIGSIGGGIMEHKFVELALTRLRQESLQNSLHKQEHNKTAKAHQSGMICSGEQTNAILCVTPNELANIDEIVNKLNARKTCVIELASSGLTIQAEFLKSPLPQTDITETWVSAQTIGPSNELIIIGGGHCALALSRHMYLLDFTITLFEERANLLTVEQNIYIDKLVIVEDYSLLNDQIEGGDNVYVIVMTMGYRTDDIAIRSIKNKHFKYFGILGSQAKIDTLFNEYRHDKFQEDWLNALSAPAGLFIKSQSPEEIAISIVAEIIGVKNGL